MKRILGILLMVILLTIPFSSVYALETPQQPEAGDFTTNEEIKDYNDKVDKYNEEVDKYNAAVDEEYNTAVEEVNQQNAAGIKAQEESQKAHDDAVAANEAEQKRVDEENAKIDEENKAEEERVNQSNAEKQAQYDVDKGYADKIFNLTGMTVEEYNNYIYDTYKYAPVDPANPTGPQKYLIDNNIEEVNNFYKQAGIKNYTAKPIVASDTYHVDDTAERSGKIITVNLIHTIYNKQYEPIIIEDSFSIDANDILLVKPLSAVAESLSSTLYPEDSLAMFFYNDNKNWYGYYYEGWSEVWGSVENEWQNGDTHTIIPSTTGSGPININYNYFWSSIGKMYNEPILDLETFVKKPYIEANLVEVPEVIEWTLLPAPIKQAYLSYLDKMGLLPEPTPTPTVTPTPTPTPVIIYGRGDGDPVEEVQITDTETPTTMITAANIPKSKPKPAEGSWALINLICAILSCIIAVVLLFIKKKTDDEEEEYTDEEKKDIHGIRRFKIYSILVGIISVIAFILTEDMTLPMILIDKWTILMVILLLVNVINIFVMRKKSKEEDDDDDIE